jgi:hypothetical protein
MSILRPLASQLHAVQLCACLSALLLSPNAFAVDSKPYRWTQFVQTQGQTEPVPVEWVSTPEGKFAHSIKLPDAIPKPVPFDFGKAKLVALVPGKPSVSQQYFDHLCNTEAGEYIFASATVAGFYFARPPKRPTDDDLKHRYRLEAPEIERTFQLYRANPDERATIFIDPPWAKYSYMEEPDTNMKKNFVRTQGYRQNVSKMTTEHVDELTSQYGLLWRGIRRTNDRELAIAGSEWIIFNIGSKEVLALQRNYAATGHTRNTDNGLWWLNATSCPKLQVKNIFSKRFYQFLSKVLVPVDNR